MLEINSNPSFNINISTFEKNENNDFKLKNEVSEIDKYIKSLVLTDAFKILTCGMPTVKKLGSFERLLPPQNGSDKYKKFMVIDDVREVFE